MKLITVAIATTTLFAATSAFARGGHDGFVSPGFESARPQVISSSSSPVTEGTAHQRLTPDMTLQEACTKMSLIQGNLDDQARAIMDAKTRLNMLTRNDDPVLYDTLKGKIAELEERNYNNSMLLGLERTWCVSHNYSVE